MVARKTQLEVEPIFWMENTSLEVDLKNSTQGRAHILDGENIVGSGFGMRWQHRRKWIWDALASSLV